MADNEDVPQRMLTKEHIDSFHKDGYVVIEGVLTDAEVDAARAAFHADLATIGIDHGGIFAGTATAPPECAIKSAVANIYYSRWKLLDVHLKPNIVAAMRELLSETFISSISHDEYPGPAVTVGLRNLFAYVDRAVYRLPNDIRNEKGLDLHLDRHPTKPFDCIKKWRPIQSFVTLTDHWGGSTGGLQVVPGFHRRIDEYFAKGAEIKESAGEFYRMTDHAHDKLREGLITVQAPKGSLVCWDNRVAHATCARLSGRDSREAVFTGFLPDVAINRRYIAEQRRCMLRSLSPPAYDAVPVRGPDFNPRELSEEQRALLGF